MATSIVARGNTIWVGTDEGLLEVEPERNIFRHLKEDDGLLRPNVNSLSLLGNKLYMGLGSGAGYLDILEHHFTGLITTNEVVRVASSPEGLWVITRAKGLIFFSEKSDKKISSRFGNALILSVWPSITDMSSLGRTCRSEGLSACAALEREVYLSMIVSLRKS